MTAFLATSLAWADPPILSLPLACDLPKQCRVTSLVDHDPSRGFRDYRGLNLTYDGHKGTDFAITRKSVFHRGIHVLAAAPGRVVGVRNTMPDRNVVGVGTSTVVGRECGNGVRLDLGSGWEMQYCHMRWGSITVKRGARVERGQKLGLIGLSGRSEYPHLHVQVVHNGRVVDPFFPSRLWSGSIVSKLTPTSVVIGRAGLSGWVPSFSVLRSGRAKPPSPHAPALVAWVELFGVRRGDRLRWQILSPNGRTFLETSTRMKKNSVHWFGHAGKKRYDLPWPSGQYRVRVELYRDLEIPMAVNESSHELPSVP
ncbi:MAG: M23 family metallopeptidase [Magnetococcales bacterium]|nr:M23 family metallopeptidase [Magnetococcales bacterium]